MDWWNRLTTFLKEVRSEMQKVSYPGRDEVVSTSIVVIIASFIFGGFLYAADIVIQRGYQWIIQALG